MEIFIIIILAFFLIYIIGNRNKNSINNNKNIINENGENIIYFDNGKSDIIEEKFTKSDGEIEGNRLWNYENGSQRLITSWKNGKQHGNAISFNENSNIIRRSSFRDGKPFGNIEEFYSDNSIRLKINLKKNFYEGYRKNGSKLFEGYLITNLDKDLRLNISYRKKMYYSYVWGGDNSGGYGTKFKPIGIWKSYRDDGTINKEYDFSFFENLGDYIDLVFVREFDKKSKLISENEMQINSFEEVLISNRSDSIKDRVTNHYDIEPKLDSIFKSSKVAQKSEELKIFIKSSNPETYAFSFDDCAHKFIYEFMSINGGIKNYKLIDENYENNKDYGRLLLYKIWNNNKIKIELKCNSGDYYEKRDGVTEDLRKKLLDQKNIVLITQENKKNKSNPTEDDVVDQYKIDNSLPSSMEFIPGSPKFYKRDMTGLMAYFEEMTNMKRIFNEFTHSIRNGISEEKYLEGANILDDEEVRGIVEKGFIDISTFLKDILEIKEKKEMRKDYNATLNAIKILQSHNKSDKKNIKIDEDELIDIGIVSHYNDKPFTGIGTSKLDDGYNLETSFKDGMKHGDQCCYYEDGSILFIKEFIDDKFVSTKEFNLKNGLSFDELKSYVCMYYIRQIIEADGIVSDLEDKLYEHFYTTILSKEKIENIDKYIEKNRDDSFFKDKDYFINILLNLFSKDDFYQLIGLTVLSMTVDGNIDDKELKILYNLGEYFGLDKDGVDEYINLTLDASKEASSGN